ncbi:hypothetical protein ACHAPZ_000783 [Fusarium culmorum]|uniref:CFEM domain-containing protein n=1 Tax=Fusarium culmorum TaxID=5516 RepID=A0A2T4HBK3_FUSCU|nr:hypothetical protein FCULG_00004888 [Fusarium culmorum]
MRKPTAAQLALLMASVATAADTTCAIDCFQGLITNGPPADCKEATNYLCFCTMPTLQENFLKCADTSCGKDTSAALTWANELCAKLGKPIDLGPGDGAPKTDATTAIDATTAVEAPASTTDETKQTTTAETTVPEAVQTTATEAEKTDSKAEETSIETSVPSGTSQETSQDTPETCTTETTMTKTETTFAKATTTEGASVTTDEDGSVGIVTGSGETATSSSDAEVNAGSITTPGLLAVAGVLAALWQFM